eukprot:TRINITY_DN686_c0_g1_i1.p2 TRINITY_DN686_c0_g1~~TRINITY_DN686_c0_g1_i1.p2  ORF type:complete len:209 (+),score=39.01 TRINITY_DN686_c0_g1_i1:78-704(+)
MAAAAMAGNRRRAASLLVAGVVGALVSCSMMGRSFTLTGPSAAVSSRTAASTSTSSGRSISVGLGPKPAGLAEQYIIPPEERPGKNYRISVLTPRGWENFDCNENMFILDCADEAGVNLPSHEASKTGAAPESVARIMSGKINRVHDRVQSFLGLKWLKQGYIMLDVAMPKSDMKIRSHQRIGLEAKTFGFKGLAYNTNSYRKHSLEK